MMLIVVLLMTGVLLAHPGLKWYTQNASDFNQRTWHRKVVDDNQQLAPIAIGQGERIKKEIQAFVGELLENCFEVDFSPHFPDKIHANAMHTRLIHELNRFVSDHDWERYGKLDTVTLSRPAKYVVYVFLNSNGNSHKSRFDRSKIDKLNLLLSAEMNTLNHSRIEL